MAQTPAPATPVTAQTMVQRDVDQRQRIENGLQTGALTQREAGRLEQGQAHVDRAEAHAAADGHVSAAEQKHVQRTENHQRARIHRAERSRV